MAKNEHLVYQITCQPGIRRDGTTLDTNFYNDGQWVRFYRGKPRKMGGMYRSGVTQQGITRALYASYNPTLNNTFVHAFNTSGIQRMQLDDAGSVSAIVSRTPATVFTSNTGNQWQHDTMHDASGGGDTLIVAHCGRPNTADDETAYPVWYGKLNTTTLAEYPLVTTTQSVSGGCVVLYPYLFIYGSNGLIQNSVAGSPTVWTGGEANSANVAGSKILKGLPIRGSGQSPAGLFWSRESLIRVSNIGGNIIWRYDTLSSQISMISANSAVEYDGVYFWVGNDRFYVYDGAVKELPNQMNLNWFFDNLNWSYRHRIWAMKMPRWGEIWWFFPSNDSADGECDKAAIYNVREKTWYDCELMRSAGHWAPTYRYPIMADPTDVPVNSGNFGLWIHEKGTDSEDAATSTSSIESYFETADFGLPTGGGADQPVGQNFWTRVIRVEPDFNQSGGMEVTVTGSNYANGTQTPSQAYPFDASTQKVDMREQRRLIRVKFSSDTIGGNYEMGKPLLVLEKGDVRG